MAGTKMRRALMVMIVTAAICGVIQVSGPRPLEVAEAAPVPVYNAPPGGGPVTYETLLEGPFTLAPQGQPGDQDEGAGPVKRPVGAFGLKSIEFDLVDVNGVSISKHDVHLHHYVIGQAFAKDDACPDRQVMGYDARPLVGTGAERTPIAFPDPYAILIGEDDVWGAVWHLMNMTDTTQTLYVKYTVGLQRGATPENTRPLTPFWTDWDGCPAGDVRVVPGDGGPGSVYSLSHQWAMPSAGIVVGIGGHLHEGGIDVVVSHQDGTEMCRSSAVYGSMGHLDRIVPCLLHDTVATGEQLMVTANYDNSARYEDVMGMAVLYVWFGDQGPPPP
ncbi:MAG: hypothetical protein N2037_10625, partial [Acidimicrobiales bacterium]|nr:hypothetical protein [Acidimicrobiales bacterium]